MPDDPIESFERRRYYEQLYQQLPKVIFNDLTGEERNLLQLITVEDRSPKEAAGLLNQDIDEIRWKWNRLKSKLQQRAKSVIRDRPKFY